MFKNYLKIAIRNIMRNKFYSAINILGLAIGMASFIMIAMWVRDETSYDRHFPNADRIYRIENILITGGEPIAMAAADCRLADFVRNEYPEVQSISRVLNVPTLLTYNGKSVYEGNAFYTDTTFFSVFAFPFLRGNAVTALAKGNIVITGSVAAKLFGNENPLGKTVYFNNEKTGERRVPRIVTGVIKDNDPRSHFHPTVIIARNSPMESFEQTYALFRNGYTTKNFASQVWNPLYDKFYRKDYEGDRQDISLNITPLTAIHLTPNAWGDFEANGNVTTIYIMSVVGFLILLIASINYTNLATARSYSRSREVGVRKLLGATKTQLVVQFLVESVVIALFSLLLAFAFIEMTLPLFNSLAGKAFTMALLSGRTIWFVLVLAIVTGCASGLYPAFIISSFAPVKALKGVLDIRNKPSLRKSLVVIQFTLSIVTLIATIVVAHQLAYVKKKDLGFSKDQVLVVNLNDPAVKDRTEAIKDELKKNAGIETVSATRNIPGGEINHSYLEYESPAGMRPALLNAMWGDYDFPKVLNLKFTEGPGFNRSMLEQADSTIFAVMNESAVRMFGWNHGNGKKVQSGKTYGFRKGSCVGVVRDFHSASLHERIAPLYIVIPPKHAYYAKYNYLCLKIKGNDIPQCIAYARQVYKSFSNDYPFEYSFLDESFNRQYEKEGRMNTLFNYFSGLCIFISCLGLLGLASFSTRQRTKEISVRKISGASVSDIILLLVKDFIWLVFIAFVIAIPVAYYAMNKWLQNFAYHIRIEWVPFAIAGVTALVVALVTISIHTFKAANKDPAIALKYE